MAKLIKSILANRMMFRGGGLVPPSQAAGILASSSPLIDSVAMNQGGLVNYANGGEIALGASPADVATPYEDSTLNKVASKIYEIVTAAKAQGVSAVDAVVEAFNVAPAVAQGMINQALSTVAGTAEEAWRQGQERQADLWSGDVLPDGPFKRAVTTTLGDIVDYGTSSNNADVADVADVSVAEQLNGTSPMAASVDEQLSGTTPMATVADAPSRTPAVELRDFPGQDIQKEIVKVLSQEDLQGRYDHDPGPYADPEKGAARASYAPLGQLSRFLSQSDAGNQLPYDANLQLHGRPTRRDQAMIEMGEIVRPTDSGVARLISQQNMPTHLQTPNIYSDQRRYHYPDRKDSAEVTAAEIINDPEQANFDADLFPSAIGLGPPGQEARDAKTVAEEVEAQTVPTTEQVVAGDMIPGGPPEASLDIDKIVTGDGGDDVGGDVVAGAGGSGSGSGSDAAGATHPLSGFVLKNTVTDGIVEAAQTDNPEDLKDWIKVFKEEFIDAAPEYEGASDFEKGMAWVKTGMAIAGGTSPHAIKNIADGFLSTIDEHTTDAKEKRQYERQINLSAANYAITANNKRRDEERAIEREGQIPIEVMALENMYDPEGKLTRKKGDIFNIPKSEFQQNPNLYGGELAIENDIARREANMDAFASMLETAKDAAEANSWHDVEGFAKLEGNFRELRADAQKYTNQHNIISQSIELVGPEGSNVLGLKGAVKRWLNKGYNFLHLNRGSEGVTAEKAAEGITIGKGGEKVYDANIWVGTNKAGKRIDELGRTYEDRVAEFKEINSLWEKADDLAKEGRDGAKYLANQQRLANLLIRELLGEGSKNISNIDRDLAQQIVGLYESNAFQDPAVLMERLVYIQNDIVKNYTASRDAMDSWIDQFGAYTVGAYSPTVTTSGAMVPDTRRTVKQTIVDPLMQQFSAVDEESNWKDRVLKSSGFIESIGEDGVVRYKLSGGN